MVENTDPLRWLKAYVPQIWIEPWSLNRVNLVEHKNPSRRRNQNFQLIIKVAVCGVYIQRQGVEDYWWLEEDIWSEFTFR